MPSKSQDQHNFMAMVANSPNMAKKAEVPQSVGQDFVDADKGGKFDKSKKKSKLGKLYGGK